MLAVSVQEVPSAYWRELQRLRCAWEIKAGSSLLSAKQVINIPTEAIARQQIKCCMLSTTIYEEEKVEV